MKTKTSAVVCINKCAQVNKISFKIITSVKNGQETLNLEYNV